MDTVGDLLETDPRAAPRKGALGHGPENPAGDVLEKRLSGEESLLALQRKGKIADWMEEAFDTTLVPPIRRMIRSVMEYEDTVVLSANSIGKTFTAARLALTLFKWLTEDADIKDVEVFTSAAPPEDNLERLLWGEIYAGLDEADDLGQGWKINSMHIEAGPNSYITGVTIPRSERPEEMESRFSGKHADALFFIFDEGDAIPRPVYKGAESCMSGGSITKMLTLLNPRSPSGPVYEKVRNGECNVVRMSAFEHPNVKTGTQKIPGAVTREKTVRRIADWSRRLAENEEEPDDRVTFTVPDFLVGETARRKDGSTAGPLPPGIRVVTNPSLCHMVLAKYPKTSSYKLISESWVEAAVDRWEAHIDTHGAEVPDGAIMGYDVASVGVDKNVLCFRKENFVGHFDCKWGGVDSDVGADKAAMFYQEKGAKRAKVDTTGVGDGVPRKMRKKGASHTDGVKVSEAPTTQVAEGEFHRLRDQLYWKVREWLRPKQDEPSDAMLPPNEQLKRQLTTPTWSQTKKGEIRVMSKDEMRAEMSGDSPDEFDALALTFAPENPYTETARWSDDEFEPRL
jgi:hypothetical protein